MRFHGLMLLRDEADVLPQCLDHLLTWCDRVCVFDTGSTDGSWEIVQDFAARHPARIVPFLRRPAVYEDTMRGYLFERLRADIEPGDWVLRLDADEFYACDPGTFVREQLGVQESCVYLQWYFFRMTQPEVIAWQAGDESRADRNRSIAERRRWYSIVRYSEPRMFRYRRWMRWPHTASFPFNAGLVARARIPIRHYPHRDPAQMRRRVALRAAMMGLKAHAGSHWKVSDWRAEVVRAEPTQRDEVQRCVAQADPHAFSRLVELHDDKLYRFDVAHPLVPVSLTNHLPTPGKRLAQRAAHACVVPWRDHLRPGYRRDHELLWIDEATNRKIGDACAAAEREGESPAVDQAPVAGADRGRSA